jgi:hypothetical protein
VTVGLVVAGFGLVGNAQAAVGKKNAADHSKVGHEAHKVIHELHEAHTLLEHADHDYDGHRAKAAEEVHKAITELEHKHGKHASLAQGAKGKPGAGKGLAAAIQKFKGKGGKFAKGKEKEPQGASDAQLRRAHEILAKTEPELKKHAEAAAMNVGKAMGEIKIALKIK